MGVGFGPSNGHVDVKNAFLTYLFLFMFLIHILYVEERFEPLLEVVSSCLTKSVLQCCDWSAAIWVSCCFFQALNDLNNEDLKAKLGLEDLSEGWE